MTSLFRRAIRKYTRKYYHSRFVKVARLVRTTPSVDNSTDQIKGLAVVSMVQKKDVDMYLLALKSFVRFVPPEKIVMVADPSIDEEDKKLLSDHVPGIEFIPAQDLHRDDTPVGGTWERLNGLARVNRDYFVVQVDADTITHRRPDEVINAIRANRSFTIGTLQGKELSTLSDSAAFAKSHIKDDSPHIQLVSEALLEKFGEDFTDFKYYVRGCSGFNGFPRGGLNEDLIGQVSSWFSDNSNGRWHEWGSEQFTCNLLVANLESAQVLPVSSYLAPRSDVRDHAAFLHFIGSLRYNSDLYIRSAAQVIEELKQNA